MKRWAPDLALRKRIKVIRKWPIGVNGFLGPLSIMAEVCKTSGFGSLLVKKQAQNDLNFQLLPLQIVPSITYN